MDVTIPLSLQQAHALVEVGTQRYLKTNNFHNAADVGLNTTQLNTRP